MLFFVASTLLLLGVKASSSLTWDYSLSSSSPATWPTSWSFTSKNSSCFVNIRILKDQAECSDCASSLTSLGAYPVLLFDQEQSTFSPNQSAASLISYTATSGGGYWSLPLQTGYSGILEFTIATSVPNFTYSGSQTTIPNLEGDIWVNWLADQGLSTSLISSSNLITGATGLGVKSISGISTNHIALLSTSASSVLVSSADEFLSPYLVTLSPPSSIFSKDSCSSASISSLYWTDIAFYQDSLFLSTNGGLVRAQPSTTTSGLNWTSTGITFCIKKIKQHSQNLVFKSNWNPLVVIGGSGSEGSLSLLSNQSSSTNPLTLLDSESRDMKSALFSSISSITVVDSITSSLKKAIVFLVLTSSSQYYLVTFDVDALAWSITFRFPSTVPAYTSSSTAPYMRIWNTTSTVGAFDGITTLDTSAISLSLTGLITSSSASFDVFVMGNALFYSPNLGSQMSLVQSLSNSTFNSFAAHKWGAFAVGSADYRLWLGDFGAYYLFLTRTARTSGVMYHPHFDHAGNMYELSYSSSGLLSRSSSFNYTNLLASAGSCSYSNLTYVYYPDDQFLTALPTSSNYNVTASWDITKSDTSLPDSIFLDYVEDYGFQVRVVPTAWSNAENIKVSFQLGNATLVQLTTVRSYDYFRKTIVYDVSLKDNGVPRNASFMTTSLKVIVDQDSLACHESGAKTTTIYTGCPMKSSLSFLPGESGGILYPCPHTDSGLPCAVFEKAFAPVFNWVDAAQNLNNTYTGDYTLQVVGGGPSLSSVQYFDASSISQYNPSLLNSWLSYIWVPKSQSFANTPIFSHNTDTSIYWKCELYSACQYTLSKAGVYYLILQVQGQSSSSQTYCSVSTEFKIALINIPYPFAYDIATALSTCAFSFLVLSGYLLYNRDIFGLTSTSKSAKKQKGTEPVAIPLLNSVAAKFIPRMSVREGRVSFSEVGRESVQPKKSVVLKTAKFADPDPIEESSSSGENSKRSSIDDTPMKNFEQERDDKSGSQLELEKEWNGEQSWGGDGEDEDDEDDAEIEEYFEEGGFSQDEDEALLEDLELAALDGFQLAKPNEAGTDMGDVHISLSSLNQYLTRNQ